MCPTRKPADRKTRQLVIKKVVASKNNLHHQQPTTGHQRKISQPSHPALLRGRGKMVLLRKEVIQPHLPVRLPCYDFVPIADPTFDGSLHKG